MSNQLIVSALFYKGKLFQIGDVISGKGEYLSNFSGFENYNIGGVITKIIVEVDTICNSLFLNHGFTYNSIGGLGYKFEIDGIVNYAFEVNNFNLPILMADKIRFVTAYYNHKVNADKLLDIVNFINIEFKYQMKPSEIRNIGKFLKVNHRELFDYILLTFRIRAGEFGFFSDSNELSNISNKVLSKHGLTNYVNNILYKFTSNNSTINGCYKYKSLE